MKDSSMRFKDLISAEGHCISFNLWRVKSFAFTVQKTISNTKVGGNDDVHSLNNWFSPMPTIPCIDIYMKKSSWAVHLDGTL